MLTDMRVAVRVRPGASRTDVGGRYGDSDVLLIAVGARAVDGAATEAARRALAGALGVRRPDVTLVTGATSRDKVFDVDMTKGDESAIADRLAALLDR